MPFREAHEIVGALVAHAVRSGTCRLNQIPLSDMQSLLATCLISMLRTSFDVRRSLARAAAIGAPAPENIASADRALAINCSTSKAARSANPAEVCRWGQRPLQFRRVKQSNLVRDGEGWETISSDRHFGNAHLEVVTDHVRTPTREAAARLDGCAPQSRRHHCADDS